MLSRSLLLVVLLLCPGLQAGDERPSFVVINVDDLGYGDIGPYGSTLNRTPNLDRMAAEGRRLTCFYAAPVCSPSRAALMTGCYPKRALPIPHVLFPGNPVGLNPNELTVAELLKREGYRTAIIGKWHLGDQPDFLPTRQGFDEFFGLPYSNDMGPTQDGVKSNLREPLPAPKENEQPPLPWMRGERVIKRVLAEDQTTLVRRYTEEAVDFVRRNRNRPFFLYLPHSAVHFPLYPGRTFQGHSSNGLYGDWVEEVDWSVGQLIEALRECRIEGRTLVLFTSDNGGTPRGRNTPLRGHKGSTWEGGMRVPTLAWWPGRIPAGTATDAVMGMIDVLPTFVALAGGAVPRDRKLDGTNVWPLIAGEATATPAHDVFFYFKGLELEAVRRGPWKYHLARKELYHLGDDVAESVSRSAEHPEVVLQLERLAASMAGDLGLTGIGPGVRPLGRVSDSRPLIDDEGRIRPGFE